MKQFIKEQFNPSDLLIAIVNLVPIYGVWVLGWNPAEVFLVYCLETVIIGLFNVVKMLLSAVAQNLHTAGNNEGMSVKASLFLTLFFILHYGIFVIVQMTMFFGVLRMGGEIRVPSGLISFITNLHTYISPSLLWLLAGFIISYAFGVIKTYILNGRYKRAKISFVMFEPYPRIFVQQFAVILGAFFLALGAGKIFIIIFALVKIIFETAIDYEGLMRQKLKGSV